MPDTQIKPSRQRSAAALRRPFWSLAALVDQGFFLLAGAASFWLAWLVWREGWNTGGWQMVTLFVVVWFITAYLALPRLHRILTSLYVPNYFIGRTRTADGLLGDPVNLAVRGSEMQLHQAMAAAGWTRADAITLRSSWRIIVATLTRRSYPHAPVSSLFLFGRRQDFAYQQEVDGNPGQRHHVRFWRCPQGWLLPGGHQVDWLAAGTYDSSVGVSLFTLQITHKIDENIDIERDHIVHTVIAASPEVRVANLENFSTGYHSRNGGGDSVQTDGNLLVLEVDQVEVDTSHGQGPSTVAYEARSEGDNTFIQQLWSRRPPQITFGILTISMTILLSLVNTVFEFINIDQLRQQIAIDMQSEAVIWPDSVINPDWLIGTSIAVSLIFLGFMAFLGYQTFRGDNKSRILLMSLASFSALVASSALTIGKMTWSSASLLLFVGLNIIAVMMFSSDDARLFTRTRSYRQ